MEKVGEAGDVGEARDGLVEDCEESAERLVETMFNLYSRILHVCGRHEEITRVVTPTFSYTNTRGYPSLQLLCLPLMMYVV